MNKKQIAKTFQAHLLANGFKVSLAAISKMDTYQFVGEKREYAFGEDLKYLLEEVILEHTDPAAYHAQYEPICPACLAWCVLSGGILA